MLDAPRNLGVSNYPLAEIHTRASDQKGSVQTRKASRQRQNCARNLECDSRGLTSTIKICARTQYVGLAEQCQRPLAGPAMNFGAPIWRSRPRRRNFRYEIALEDVSCPGP